MENNSLLLEVINSLPHAVLVFDPRDDKVVMCNQKICDLLGTSADDLPIQSIFKNIGLDEKSVTYILEQDSFSNRDFIGQDAKGEPLNIELSRKWLDKEKLSLITLDDHPSNIEESKIGNSQLRDTLDAINDAVITIDSNSRISHINRVAEIYSGVAEEGAIGKKLEDILKLRPVNDKQKFNKYNDAVQTYDDNQTEYISGQKYHLTLPNDDSIIVENYQIGMHGHNDDLLGWTVIFRDITAVSDLISEISYQASHDELTKLINRREFEKRLTTALEETRADNSTHALLFMDLDQFKIINDTCGHLAGDNLLREVATLFKQQLRKHDTLSRFGGDEFGILLEHCSQDRAMILAEKIRRKLKEYRFNWDNKVFSIGVSIGVVPITKEQSNLTTILSLADSACYRAKEAGRNRVYLYRADDANFTTKHLQMRWVPIISKSIDEGRILLYQQTITRTDASIVEAEHYEILMRLQDDKGEIISPVIIIPAAENYNMMHRIDRYVVKHTFEWLAEHDAARDRLGLCSINLSGLTLNDENFLGFLESELLRYDIEPEKICFEITETAAISNYQQACSFIHHVKRFGCTFALDDFGSGMSSFSYLNNLAVDFVKIDGIFVKDMVENKINAAIVKSINDVAHIMEKETIAECVESEEIRVKLLELGVDYVQGFGIQRPQPLDNLAGTGRVGDKPVS